MKINKKYHFYAGHRNENLDDKCRNLHGHTYYVTMDFDFTEFNQATGITMLFSDIDSIVNPIICGYNTITVLYLCQVALILQNDLKVFES